MEGEQNNSPVFHSDDIKSSKANSDKEYFVNVINDPFQQWLLRKKPAKVKVKQEFETPVPPPKEPEAKPKSPQCRVAIRLTTERLRRDSSRYKTPFTLLSIAAIFVLGLAAFFAYLAFFGEKKVETKTVYVNVPAETPKESEKPNKTEEQEEPEEPENPTEDSESPEEPEEPIENSDNPEESGTPTEDSEENSGDEPARGGGE